MNKLKEVKDRLADTRQATEIHNSAQNTVTDTFDDVSNILSQIFSKHFNGISFRVDMRLSVYTIKIEIKIDPNKHRKSPELPLFARWYFDFKEDGELECYSSAIYGSASECNQHLPLPLSLMYSISDILSKAYII